MVDAENVTLRYSTTAGAAGGSLAGTADGSLGKFLSTTVIPGHTGYPLQDNNLFPDVTEQQAQTGITFWRCIFVWNGDIGAFNNAGMWIESQGRSAKIEIGQDPIGVVAYNSGSAQAEQIANGTTEPTTVDDFRAALIDADAHIGFDAGSDQVLGIWVRMTVEPDALPLENDQAIIAYRSTDESWTNRLTLQWSVAPSPNRVSDALNGTNGPVVTRFAYTKRTIDNALIEDVSDAIRACSIVGNNNRAVFRTATFAIDPDKADIDPLADWIGVSAFVRLNATYEYEIPCGLFKLSIPKPTHYTSETLWEVAAADMGIILAQSGPTTAYEVASGVDYFTAVNTILTAVGVPSEIPNTSGITTPSQIAFEPGTTWLEIVNTLLEGAGHYGAKASAAGKMRTRQIVDFANRDADVTYSDDDWIVGEISEEQSTTSLANQVVVRSSNPLQSVITASRTNIDPESPISTVALGYVIQRVIDVDTVADQAAADAIADRYLREASEAYVRATINTQLDPRRGPWEAYTINVDGIYDAVKWIVQDWQFDCAPGAIMVHGLGRTQNLELVDTP